MKRIQTLLAVVAILAASTLLQSEGIRRPWSGKDTGYNGAFYSILARNYLRYGLLQTKLGPVRNSGKAERSEFKYYLNHPPLLPIVVSLSFRCFGVNEWAARGVAIAFSFFSLFILYLFSKEIWGQQTAFVATTIASFVPITLFYGSHVEVFGPLLLFFVLLTVYFYWRWFTTNQNRYLLFSVFAFCLGAFVEA